MHSHSKLSTKLKIDNQSICPQCNAPLQTYDTIKYCENCLRCPTFMDNCIRQPNYNFKQHYQENRLQAALKIQAHIRDVFCKLSMKVTGAESQGLVEKVLALHRRRGINKKGYKEQTAAIIFIQYQEEIRMTAHQFCTATGLTRKKFNKMYINYRNVKKIQKAEQQDKKKEKEVLKLQEQQQENINLKEQQSHEQQRQPQQQQQQQIQQFEDNHLQQKISASGQIYQTLTPEMYPNHPLPPSQDPQYRQTLLKTIQKLYPKLFPQQILQKHKQQLIKSIVDKCLTLSQNCLQNSQSLKKYFRAPAMIYNVIKLHGYKLTKKKYIEIVERQLQVKLTDRMIGKYAKGVAGVGCKVEEDEQGSSPTFVENRNQTPTKSDICV